MMVTYKYMRRIHHDRQERAAHWAIGVTVMICMMVTAYIIISIAPEKPTDENLIAASGSSVEQPSLLNPPRVNPVDPAGDKLPPTPAEPVPGPILPAKQERPETIGPSNPGSNSDRQPPADDDMPKFGHFEPAYAAAEAAYEKAEYVRAMKIAKAALRYAISHDQQRRLQNLWRQIGPNLSESQLRAIEASSEQAEQESDTRRLRDVKDWSLPSPPRFEIHLIEAQNGDPFKGSSGEQGIAMPGRPSKEAMPKFKDLESALAAANEAFEKADYVRAWLIAEIARTYATSSDQKRRLWILQRSIGPNLPEKFFR